MEFIFSWKGKNMPLEINLRGQYCPLIKMFISVIAYRFGVFPFMLYHGITESCKLSSFLVL